MPVNHMVWIKFAATITHDRVEEHLTALRGLESAVPGILDLTLGRNFTDRANGYSHGLSVILESRDALAAYATHPVHVRVATELRRDAEILALDYEY